LIEEIQSQFPQYGVRQVYWELLWGYKKRINRKRIHRVMREHGLRAQIYRGFKVATTDSDHSNRIYPNLLHAKEVSAPNQVWASDITYVRIGTCFVYLAAILDLFSRRVVGWAISKKINTELCLAALKMAVENRKPPKGLVHHSDRGVQYTSDEYVGCLKENGIDISMSRKGNCWDNAFMESFF
jgi:transposase InsO family protein